MNKTEVDALLCQIRNIILNKPISCKIDSESEDLGDLQEAIVYLSNCLSESNEFLKQLSAGNLDAKTPSRHNFLAGSLKELHSGLKHLTWQANQVASGDYNQQVSFLGDFSISFNKMISQLSERESQLKQQSRILAKTNSLMMSIMDGLKDWVIVTARNTGEVIYTNESAKRSFYNPDTDQHTCGKSCKLMSHLKEYRDKNTDYMIFEYCCPVSNRFYRAKTFLIQWNEDLAYVHYIIDVTNEKEDRDQIEELAYKDELTGLYNRRHCIGKLEDLLKNKADFSFCMIDLDGLKFANDNFGHGAGDEYLNIVAEELLKICRNTDVVCRIGGDEFAVIFPACNEQIVLDKMSGLDEKLHIEEKDYPMSISYGVVYVEKDKEVSLESVISQADERMYILKKLKKSVVKNKGGIVMAFTWSKELEIGNVQIDEEHKELFKAINNLLGACAAGKGRNELSNTIEFLSKYTKTHFRHEEALQMRYNYPDYENHKKYHETFVKEVEDISARLKNEGPSITLVGAINMKLGNWLIRHIKSEDIKVAKHISGAN